MRYDRTICYMTERGLHLIKVTVHAVFLGKGKVSKVS